MSHPWNVCHYWESTDLALNFGATQFLSLKKLVFLWTGTGFRYCHFAVTSLWLLTVFPFHFHVVHFGFLWHLFRFDVTLPFFGFLPQSRYLVRLLLCGHMSTPPHTRSLPSHLEDDIFQSLISFYFHLSDLFWVQLCFSAHWRTCIDNFLCVPLVSPLFGPCWNI